MRQGGCERRQTVMPLPEWRRSAEGHGYECEPVSIAHANASLSVGIKSAGKGFARARDGAAFCPRNRPTAAAEIGDSAPACANVAANRGFFQRPQETGLMRDCVVGLVGLNPTTNRLWTRWRSDQRRRLTLGPTIGRQDCGRVRWRAYADSQCATTVPVELVPVEL
jgi:hypothetical protein